MLYMPWGQQNIRIRGTGPADPGAYQVSTLTFPNPLRLYRLFGTLSFSVVSLNRRDVLRECLLWVDAPGLDDPTAGVVTQTVPQPANPGFYHQGVGSALWQGNYKSAGESYTSPVAADYGPSGLLLPKQQLRCWWDLQAWRGYQQSFDPNDSPNCELQLVLAFDYEATP